MQTVAETSPTLERPSYLKTKKLTKTAAHIMQVGFETIFLSSWCGDDYEKEQISDGDTLTVCETAVNV